MHTLAALAVAAILELAPSPTSSPSPTPTPTSASIFDIEVPKIAPPAGMGVYCQLTYPSGGWALETGAIGEDPCAEMLERSPGGTIARAGLFSRTGENNVVVRCGGGVGLYPGTGEAVLDHAAQRNRTKKHCTFTVAPKKLPIFVKPHAATDAQMTGANWFDFARGYTVVTNGGASSACVRGDGSYCPSDLGEHEAYDYNLPGGTDIFAAAKGVVLMARARDVQGYIDDGCADVNGAPSPNSSRYQNEMYVLHKVGAGKYAEFFVSYYAHFSSMAKQTGDIVARGEKLGDAGSTGCSTGNHLHFEVTRFTNIAGAWRRSFEVPLFADYDRVSMIDPYGWSGTRTAFDPWAWRDAANGNGALSIDMWMEGERPER